MPTSRSWLATSQILKPAKRVSGHGEDRDWSYRKPEVIQWAPGLPKTRSGKIMRRILRKIAANELDSLGDTSTLADPAVVDDLVANEARDARVLKRLLEFATHRHVEQKKPAIRRFFYSAEEEITLLAHPALDS